MSCPYYRYLLSQPLIFLLLTSHFAQAASLLLPATGIKQNPAKIQVQLNPSIATLSKGEQLTLIPSSPIRISFDKLDRYKNNHQYTWLGHLTDHDKTYRVIITVTNSIITGRITTADGILRLKHSNGKTYLVDNKQLGLQAKILANDTEEIPVLPNSLATATAKATNTADTIDLLILYNPSFANRYPGSQLQNRFDQLLALTRQAYADSGIELNIRLVATQQINYSNTESNSVALRAITFNTIAGENIDAMRDQAGADLVTIMRPFDSDFHDSCGRGWLGSALPNATFGYSAVSDSTDEAGSNSFCGELTLAHEMGHNFGSQHDRANATNNGAFPYSFGHGINGNFGTVMSLFQPRLGLFSSPDLSCNGNPCGVAVGETNEANNVLSINNIKTTVAGFRTSSSNSRLKNISTRSFTGTGDDVAIAGFEISGSDNKTVIVRAAGPSITGVSSATLSDTTLNLFQGSELIASNDDWLDSPEASSINNAGFGLASASESAIKITLAPGSYTAIARGKNNSTGISLIAVDEFDNSGNSTLGNISTRSQTSNGDQIVIGGFIIEGDIEKNVVIRAFGPAMIDFGVPNTVADPFIEVFSGANKIAENDDWQGDDNANLLKINNLAPAHETEAALYMTLAPGAYTVKARSINNTTGIILIAIDEV